MTFSIPNDDVLSRLFDLLDEKDIAEITKQFDADVARTRANLIQTSDDIVEGNSFSFSSVSKSNETWGREITLNSDEYRLPKFSYADSSAILMETKIENDITDYNKFGDTRTYTKAA